MKYRKKPVVIEAVQWKGGDYQVLKLFCGRNWGRADAVGLEVWPSDLKDKEEVVVFKTCEQQWLAVPVGHWIIRGVRGELYACAPDVFAETYDEVAEAA